DGTAVVTASGSSPAREKGYAAEHRTARSGDEMLPYLILFAIVFGVNLLPAFGPPTWTIVVVYGIGTHLPLPAVVPIAALAAASGRLLLALLFRLLRGHIPSKMKRNLEAAGRALE